MGALYEFFSDSPILVGAALGVIIAVLCDCRFRRKEKTPSGMAHIPKEEFVARVAKGLDMPPALLDAMTDPLYLRLGKM